MANLHHLEEFFPIKETVCVWCELPILPEDWRRHQIVAHRLECLDSWCGGREMLKSTAEWRRRKYMNKHRWNGAMPKGAMMAVGR